MEAMCSPKFWDYFLYKREREVLLVGQGSSKSIEREFRERREEEGEEEEGQTCLLFFVGVVRQNSLLTISIFSAQVIEFFLLGRENSIKGWIY